MALLFTTLIIITCVLLVLIILVQNPKGGGLSSSFGGSSQVFGGVKKTTDFLDKGTWALAILLVVLVLFANVTLQPTAGEQDAQESRIQSVDAPEPVAPQQPIALPPAGAEGSELPEAVEE
jgi:preprotein translocase subunit SecG